MEIKINKKNRIFKILVIIIDRKNLKQIQTNKLVKSLKIIN